jgi:pyranose oxidase
MATQELRTDVLVIGSGPVGAAFARLIGCAKEPRNVIMIDAGPVLSDPPGRHLANAFIYQQQPNLFLSIVLAQLEQFSVPPNQRRPLPPGAFIPPLSNRVNFENMKQNPKLNMPFASATYAVGGMGTHWTCCTPDPAPMERTSLIGSEEWPILLAIAQNLLNVHTDAFSPSVTNDVVRDALHAAGFPVTNLSMAAQKRVDQSPDTAHMVTWTGSDTVLGRLLDGTPEQRQRLRILAEHSAQKLLRDGQRVTGAEVIDLTNSARKIISADTVIVAAGAFLTPLLLWRSGIRPDALGRYLNGNQTVSSKVVLTTEIIEQVRAARGAGAGVDIPIPWDEPPVMLGTDPTELKPWHTQIQRMGQYLSYDLQEQVGIPEPYTDARLIHDLIWFGMVEPRWENRITFDDKVVDRFGQPQITIEYLVGSEELKIEAAMLQDMTNAASAIGRFIPQIGEPMPQGPGSTLHYHGTCRMGDDGATSVVDPDCKVWEFENLYLGSVGVIPNKMASNPTLTACALAARAAARILERTPQELAVELGITAGELV